MIHRPSPRILVSVVHADPLVAVGVRTVLQQQDDMDVGSSPSGQPLVGVPLVVVADYEQGLRFAEQRRRQRELRERTTGTGRVLVLTANDREHDVRSALEAGVDGYLELGCPLHELIAGVRQLARGSRYLSAMAGQHIAASMARSTLTGREHQVLSLVARGKSNKSVALALEISAGTVKAHMKAILSKLDAETRTEAASIALQRGLLEGALATA